MISNTPSSHPPVFFTPCRRHGADGCWQLGPTKHWHPLLHIPSHRWCLCISVGGLCGCKVHEWIVNTLPSITPILIWIGGSVPCPVRGFGCWQWICFCNHINHVPNLWLQYHLGTLKSPDHTLVFMTYDEALEGFPMRNWLSPWLPSDRFDLW